MKIDTTLLRSKVGLRIFVLFVLCALLPIAALAIISFSQVTKQLQEQSLTRLQQASEALGMSTIERLTLLETEMKMVASTLPTNAKGASFGPPKAVGENLEQRFEGLEVITEDGRSIPLVGQIQNPPPLTPAQREHLLSSKAVVSNILRPEGGARAFMSCALDPQNPMKGILLGEINTTFLWNADMLPPQTELCVVDEAQRVLSCTPGIPTPFRPSLTGKIRSLARGRFEWSYGGKEFLASYWSIPLKYSYFTPGWTVVLSESKADVLAPLAKFKATFPLVILMALWVVLLLSIIQIRRSLVPLEKLQEGTRRIAARDFDSRVTVTSKDEFEELATSFNAMAGRLGRQFNALTTISEIGRAVLSSLETEKIVDTVLARMADVLPCDFASVTLLDPQVPGTVRTYIPRLWPREKWWRMPIGPEEMQKLRDNRESLLIKVGEEFPKYVAPLTMFGVKSILLLPIFLEQDLSGIINVGYRTSPQYSQDDLAQARQLADQVAVALSNARLIEKLKQFSWGTLTALARAIDAKSPWTAGHSERVTSLAMNIAQVMGYAEKDLERMRRGGLLHDIGKIGTPPGILDKAGKLNPEELKTMRDHVRLGAHILEPIPGFAEVVPIVLQHHEWVDGSGYPEGLAGDAISLDARIFAVADCFDALVSDRPYRAGLSREQVIGMIKDGSGRQFDPKAVHAFLKVMEDYKKSESEGVLVTTP
ncbi:MAG: HD domain-containing phosphohydrolase [Terriglobia bacterium]|jgi:putative nucleotidyltransferase with HDIG domain